MTEILELWSYIEGIFNMSYKISTIHKEVMFDSNKYEYTATFKSDLTCHMLTKNTGL